MKYKTQKNNNAKIVALAISVIMIIGVLPLTALAEVDQSVIVGKGVTYTPKNEMTNIPWDRICAHCGFDGAFTSDRAHFSDNECHIQLDGNDAYFYGYYTSRYSDYLYYKESDSTEKTFKFTMLFSMYPAGSNIIVPQQWHSLRSVGFLVNCVENDDLSISGYYVSFEPNNIVLR